MPDTDAPPQVPSPPPAEQPPRPAEDPAAALLTLASELAHVRNEKALAEYLRLRRAVRK